MAVGATYSRYSTSLRPSTEDQLRTNIEAAARKRIYIPPEFVSLDEATSGRRSRRAGFDRLKFILEHNLADALVFFALSRLFRKQYQTARFIEEEIIERGLRAVAAVQSIDTRDEKASRWRVSILGTADELQVEATAEHVRASHVGLFLKGCITGEQTPGYRKREVPDAPKTKRGLPRDVAEADPVLAEMMRQHFVWISEGMPIAEGRRCWNAEAARAAAGSVPRLSPQAYRRMLSNRRLTGRWEFGRKRNKWSSKKDYIRQVRQPDSEVKQVYFEHLRIISDDLWQEVQDRLAAEPRGLRKVRWEGKPPVAFWDLLTAAFHCPYCHRRFYQYGSNGELMHCASPDCPWRGAVRRKDAVLAVAGALQNLILQDPGLVQHVVTFAARRASQVIVRGRRRTALLGNVNRLASCLIRFPSSYMGGRQFARQVGRCLHHVLLAPSPLRVLCGRQAAGGPASNRLRASPFKLPGSPCQLHGARVAKEAHVLGKRIAIVVSRTVW